MIPNQLATRLALALSCCALVVACGKKTADKKPGENTMQPATDTASPSRARPAPMRTRPDPMRPRPAPRRRAAAAPKGMWTFDADIIGKVPTGLSEDRGRWRVEKGAGDAKAVGAPKASQVLVQQAKNGRPIFNVALAKDTTSSADLELSVRLQARTGRIDQGGGLVWRAADSNNYYIARYNPLEDNLRLYTVKGGKRRQLASATVRLDHKAWHHLRILARGPHHQVFLNNKKLLDVKDTTFKAPGRIGLWTKADAITAFDNLHSRPLER